MKEKKSNFATTIYLDMKYKEINKHQKSKINNNKLVNTLKKVTTNLSSKVYFYQNV